MNRKTAVSAIEAWFSRLPIHTDGLPARGSVAAGLVILERLKTEFTLKVDDHRAKGGAQIKGLTASAVRSILTRHGENRPFVKEGGRTNRGTPWVAESLMDAIAPLRLGSLTEGERVQVLDACQTWLAEKVQDYFNRKRVEFVFDPRLTTYANIRRILRAAKDVGKLSSVAQYLVGAKLQLRFPHLEVANELASSSDDSTGREGDFEIGDTAFHITIAPGIAVVEKCQVNLSRGLRAFLLVPEVAVLAARDLVLYACEDQVAVMSIESFVSANIEELSEFSQEKRKSEFRQLLELYNDRVVGIETDLSLLIEIPPNL